MKNKIRKITESFPDYKYDMETTIWDWVIYFNDEDKKFFFELPNHKDKSKNDNHKVKMLIEGEWIIFEGENIDELIEKTKQKLEI